MSKHEPGPLPKKKSIWANPITWLVAVTAAIFITAGILHGPETAGERRDREVGRLCGGTYAHDDASQAMCRAHYSDPALGPALDSAAKIQDGR